MNVENPIAFSFIFQDDIYLLRGEWAALRPLERLTADAPVVVSGEMPEKKAPVVVSQPIIETPAVNFNYLGSYKKKLLIIVHYTGTEFIAEKHLTALESVLTRLGFSLDDVAIFNRANFAETPFSNLTDFFNPQKMLLLGTNALPQGIEILALNKIKPVNNCNTLFSFSFDEMMDNNEYKKAFWEQMKLL
jgi:hypothetical protein